MPSDLHAGPRLPSTRGERVAVGVAPAALVGLFIGDLAWNGDRRALTVVFLMLSWAPLLLVHELGHALAAWSVGWPVPEIVIGHGRELGRWRLGDTLVRWKPVPIEGYIVPAPRTAGRGRLAGAWIYLGGPLAEILVLTSLVALSGGRVLRRVPDADLALMAMQGTAIAIGISLFFNLLPIPRGGNVNDGLGILLSFTQDPRTLERRLLAPALTAIRRALLGDDPDAMARGTRARGVSRRSPRRGVGVRVPGRARGARGSRRDPAGPRRSGAFRRTPRARSTCGEGVDVAALGRSRGLAARAG